MTARVALPALASATFVYVTAESFPVGALPEISADLHVSEATVGLLLTSYALVAALTTIPLVARTALVPRRRLLLLTVVLLAVSQLGAALAPTFAVLVVARLVCALAHGVLWSVIAPVAAALVPADRAARATAVVFAGTSLALLLGTPLTTALSQGLGWRAAAALLGAASALVVVALRTALPPLPATVSPAASERAPVGRDVTLISGSTGVLALAHFVSYTFVAVIGDDLVGARGTGLTLLLLGYGTAGLLGVATVGRWGDRRPRACVVGCCAGLVVAFGLLASSAAVPGGAVLAVVAICLWGGSFSALPPVLQAGILRAAPAQPDRASAFYVVAFQVGIASGAFAGGRLLDLTGTAVALAVVSGAATVVGLVTVARARRAFPPFRRDTRAPFQPVKVH